MIINDQITIFNDQWFKRYFSCEKPFGITLKSLLRAWPASCTPLAGSSGHPTMAGANMWGPKSKQPARSSW